MTEIHAVIVLVGGLALVGTGSRMFLKVAKLAAKPVPEGARCQIIWLIVIAGLTACVAILVGVWMVYRLLALVAL